VERVLLHAVVDLDANIQRERKEAFVANPEIQRE